MTRSFHIIGILNVTPDSYFDGGRYDAVSAALERAGAMLAEGADWIEVGGESTGPNSPEVPLEEELKRVIPVICAVRKKFPHARISIDTWKAEVAEEAIRAGATMVNDVTAGRSDPAMLESIAKLQMANPTSARAFAETSGKWQMPFVVLMYAKDPTPRTSVAPVQYDDVVSDIKEFLRARKEAAVHAGIDPRKIILDPGLGHFVSSDPRYSFEILSRLRDFLDLDCPVLVSPSRKSFLAGTENLPPSERLPGTIAASAVAVLNGATFIRTHDVRQVKRGCEVAATIRGK